MKYIFIINPTAGNGEAPAVIEKEINDLPEKYDCIIYRTKAPGDAFSYVQKCCEESGGEEIRFIACGGDGTLHDVMNGAAGYGNVTVTCYPCGSGNDFVKTFGGEDKFTDIGALLRADAEPIDLLKTVWVYGDNAVHFGFDSIVASSVNKDRVKNGHAGSRSYTQGIIKALIFGMRNRCTVIADGEVLNPGGEILLCTLANGMYVGGGYKCAPRSRLDDGLMEVCLVKPVSRLFFVKFMNVYKEGKHLEDPRMAKYLVYRQAKKVEVKAEPGFEFSIDGEIFCESEFTVEVERGAVRFAVP